MPTTQEKRERENLDMEGFEINCGMKGFEIVSAHVFLCSTRTGRFLDFFLSQKISTMNGGTIQV